MPRARNGRRHCGRVLRFCRRGALEAFAPANIRASTRCESACRCCCLPLRSAVAAALCFWNRAGASLAARASTDGIAGECIALRQHADGLRARNLMVAVQVACTVVLLLVTGLTLRSFSHLMNENRGFDSSHVTLAQVDLYAPQYGDSVRSVQQAKLAFYGSRHCCYFPAARRAIGGASQAPRRLPGKRGIDELIRPDHPVPEAERPLVNVRFINPGISSDHADSAYRRAQHNRKRSRQSSGCAHLGAHSARGISRRRSHRKERSTNPSRPATTMER